MDNAELEVLLATFIPGELAKDIVSEFVAIRRDLATRTLGGSSPGKFVETAVQVLEALETGKYPEKPEVDAFLRSLESRASSLDDSLRICMARTLRAMYSLRNKRNIAHKGGVDPNEYDLGFLHSAAQWVLSELLRQAGGLAMEEAGRLICRVQVPVGGLVEDFDGKRIVLADLTAREELLVLLHSHYPDPIGTEAILTSLDRRNPRTVKDRLRALWQDKAIEHLAHGSNVLTLNGLREAIRIINSQVAKL